MLLPSSLSKTILILPCERIPSGLTVATSYISQILSGKTTSVCSCKISLTSIQDLIGRLRPQNLRPKIIICGVNTLSVFNLIMLKVLLRPSEILIWSHGVGSFILYRRHPILSLIRSILRFHEIVSLVLTALISNGLISAYIRQSLTDSRTLDQILFALFRKRQYIIPNLSPLANPTPTLALNTKACANRNLILSVGRLEWQKGHDLALECFLKSNPNSKRLLFVSTSLNHYANKLLQHLPEHASVSIARFGSRIKPHNAYSNAFCLLSLSETEYMPLVILEALSYGVPIIARPNGFLAHSELPGILISKNKNQDNLHLNRLLTDSTFYQRTALSAYDTYSKYYSAEVVVPLWNKLVA